MMDWITKDWRAHRLWIGLFALAILIAAVKTPLLDKAQQQAEQKLVALNAERDKIAASLQQFREDIAAVEKMKNVIDADEAEKFLAPVDRLQAAQILERNAADAHLTHFAYDVLPEQKTTVDTVDAGQQELAISKITFAADAATDSEAFMFFDAIRNALPGRMALREISLQRIGTADAPVTDSNIHMTASVEWLSNGANKNLAEKTP